jgi:uncharacterized membrane protein
LLAVVVAMAAAMFIWTVWMGQGGQRSLDQAGATRPGDATPDAAWKGGVIYYNPADPALFVEKRMGLGWTLNFANRRAWIFLAILGVIVLISVFNKLQR